MPICIAQKTTTSGYALRVIQALSGCFYYDDALANFPLEGKFGKNLRDNNCCDGGFKGGKILDKCAYRFSDIPKVNYLDYLRRGSGDERHR